jgi:hypothetical protein
VREPDGHRVRIRKPLLTLILRYLITPWSGSPETDQKILGRVSQLIYDASIVSGNALSGPSLAGSSESLKLLLSPLTLEERTRIWNAVQKPYRLSMTYEVRVVNIDPKKSFTAPRVSSRDLKYFPLVEGP